MIGQPVRLARGCWAMPEDVVELASRCALLLETSAPDTVVVDSTAGRLHDLWLPPLPGEIHLATASPDRASRHMTRTRRPEIKSHRRQLAPQDICVVNGVVVTSLARTWRDLAAVLDVPSLVAAGDSILRAGATLEELADVVSRTPNVPGIRRARAALPLLDARSESRPESHLRVAITTPDLPRFAGNEEIYRDEGGWLATPDLSLAEARIALEYKGRDHEKPGRMQKDITRTTDMRGERWAVIEFGPVEVFRRPHQIAPEIRVLVRERAPHLLRPLRPRRVVT